MMIAIFAFVLFIGVILAIVYCTIVRIVYDKLSATKERNQNPNGTKVCIIITIVYFVCWIPTSIIEVLLHLNFAIPFHFYNTSYFILLLNPLLNPLFYAYYRHDFRCEFAALRRRQWNIVKNLYEPTLQADMISRRTTSSLMRTPPLRACILSVENKHLLKPVNAS